MTEAISNADVRRIFNTFTLAISYVRYQLYTGDDWDIPEGVSPESLRVDRNRICKALGYWNKTK